MPKPFVSPLENGRIRLRLLEESDLPLTLMWRNQDHIRRWFIHSEIISQEQHRNWFEGYLQRNDDFVFIIEETQDLNMPVGQISLYHIDSDRKTAEFGRLIIGEAEAQRKGLAKEATRLILHFAFIYLGLLMVELEVLEDNMAALAIYQACGFQEISQQNILKKLTLRKMVSDRRTPSEND